MKITSKGQVTIPQSVREKAGLLPHTEVEFKVHGKRVFLIRASKKQRRGQRIIDAMAGTATVKLSTDEIMALTRLE